MSGQTNRNTTYLIDAEINTAEADLRAMEGDLVTARGRVGYLERSIPSVRQRLRDLHREKEKAQR